MAKKAPFPGKKSSVQAGSSTKTAARVPVSFERIPEFFLQRGLIALLLFALAFSVYLNTLHHGFTLDDEAVITGNTYTKAGVKGIADIFSHDSFQGFLHSESENSVVAGGRYRPLSVAMFAVVWQLFGENPFAFHLLTVLLYALTCLVLYHTLWLLFKERLGAQYSAILTFFTALIFLLHPVHTEVVANVKGCDEILSLLFSLLSLYCVLRLIDTQKATWQAVAGACFFAACLSKENAATFLLIIPLAVYYFRNPGNETLKSSARRLAGLMTPLLVAFAIFFVIRGVVINWQYGDGASLSLMNNPFVKASGNKWVPFSLGEKMATIFYTLGLYVKLLFFPHPLTHDYYPRHIGIMTFSRMGSMFSLVLYIVLAVMAASGFQKRNLLSFGILFFLITLSIVSNIFFPVGTNMSERFLFMPSVGFSIVAGYLLVRLVQREATWKGLTIPLAVLGIVSMLFMFKTTMRNRDWVSNDVLFFKDVEVSQNSAKILTSCGASLYSRSLNISDAGQRRDMVGQAISYFNKAINVYPNHVPAIFYRGLCYEYLQNHEEAVRNYAAVTRISPNYPVRVNLARALKESAKQYLSQNSRETALEFLTQSWEENNKDAETAWLLGQTALEGKRPDQAATWLERAIALDPADARYLNALSTAYRELGDIPKSEMFRQKALDASGK